MLIFGQRRLPTVLAAYEAHYDGRRPIAAASSARPGPATQSPASAPGEAPHPDKTKGAVALRGSPMKPPGTG
jgi:hypothetical protein